MQSVINSVVQWSTHLIGSWGLPAVFVLMLLESACIPVPSEAIMPFAGFAVSAGKLTMAGIIIAGVAGNLVGSWIAYAVGYYGGRPFVDRWGRYVLLRPHHLDTAQHWFDRYGAPVVFFGRMIPIVRTFISLPAGFGRMNFWKFTLYTALGCIPWVAMLGYVGYKLGANQLEDAFVRMKALADRKKDIYDEDIEALVDQEIANAHDRIKLASLTVIAGTHGPQRATMKLNIDGQIKIEEAEGNGPVDAVFNCIKALVPHEAKLELYQVHAVTEGTDAQAEVSVRLAHEGRSMTARGSDPDTLVASAKAYLGALNKIVMKRQRDIPAVAAG